MKRVLQIISYSGLVLSLVPALLVFQGAMNKDIYINCITVGMVLWFASAIVWIKPEQV